MEILTLEEFDMEIQFHDCTGSCEYDCGVAGGCTSWISPFL